MQKRLFLALALVLGSVVLCSLAAEAQQRPRPPELGQVLPPFVRSEMKFTSKQRQQIIDLEKEVKEKLLKILTAEQRQKVTTLLRQPPGKMGKPPMPPGEGGKDKGPGKDMGPGKDGPGKDKGPGGKPPKGPPIVLPPFVTEKLNLTDTQKRDIDDLDRSTMMDLRQILTDDQWKQMHELMRKGPQGGPGGPGGRPNPGSRPGSRPSPGAYKPASQGIQWFATLDSGLREAQRTGKPILLLSAAPHCGGVPGIW